MNPSKKHAFQLALAAGLFIAVASWVIQGCSSLPVEPTPGITPAPTYSPTVDSSGGTVNPAPSPVPTRVGSDSVLAIAANSACSKYSWEDRGHAPAGYVPGVALAFQRTLCRYRAGGDSVSGIIGKSVGDSAHDALAVYGLDDPTVEGRILLDYALLIGSGMRESSGNYGEGFDRSAGAETADTAEAGPFQVSYNSYGSSSRFDALMAEYQADPSKCDLSVWSKGARGSYQSIVGSGRGADFQRFTKSCPSFAAEYAATLQRVLRKHFGPINRDEAEFRQDCVDMLKQVEKATVCQ